MPDAVISLLVAVMGGIICHYIIKWLDGNDNDNQPKENPGVAAPGFSNCVHMTPQYHLPNANIAYASGEVKFPLI